MNKWLPIEKIDMQSEYDSIMVWICVTFFVRYSRKRGVDFFGKDVSAWLQLKVKTLFEVEAYKVIISLRSLISTKKILACVNVGYLD